MGGNDNVGSIFKLTSDVGESYSVSTLFSFFAPLNYAGACPCSLTFDNEKNVFLESRRAGKPWSSQDELDGVMYQINSDGSGFTVLHGFTGGVDGEFTAINGQLPDGVLINLGELYDTARRGSGPLSSECDEEGGCGTLFELRRF